VTLLEALVLGLVQGLTEFIPISSTAHLRIIPALLGWEDPGAAASAVIQIGTLLAVVIYFWRDLLNMAGAWVRGIIRGKPFQDMHSRMAWFIILGTIPIAILGLVFKDYIETTARGLWIISVALIVLAIVLMISERSAARRQTLRDVDSITFGDAASIGAGQALALIPGVSRSGSTITMALFRGLSHAAAARFSFLLSVPAIGASGLFELVGEWDHLSALGWKPILLATVVAFISGWLSIWFLLRYLRTHTTTIFIYYRIVLGVLILALLGGGWLR